VKKNGKLAEKVAIITGGASGMGRGMCLEFASQGALIGVADVNKEGATRVAEEVQGLGGQAIALEVDVREHKKVEEAVAKIFERFGTCDILANCAGFNQFRDFKDTTIDHWEYVRSINLDGTWYFSKAVAPIMMENLTGKILNIGSGAAIQGIPQAIPYATSKHGVVGLTRALAVDLGPYNINVNCICPGTIETPMLKQAASEAYKVAELPRYPLGRLGEISDVVKAALFLVSSDADWVTGVVLPVDGGLTSCIRVRNTF